MLLYTIPWLAVYSIIYSLLFYILTVIMFIFCRSGQACNHIAALLFFIEHHVNDEILPTEISKTSKPMIWNQPSKKTVASECSSSMRFVKPCHGDLPMQ